MSDSTISPALASILRSGRAEFNARFSAARRAHPELDTASFADFLVRAVDPLMRAIEKMRPDRLPEVASAAYDAGLELLGQRLAGSTSRTPWIEEGWRRIFIAAAPVVASAPGRIIPAVCNALHQLLSTPGARPVDWIEIMETLGPQCPNADTFLQLGQLAAWRAGLAHFRAGALAAADSLPENLAVGALTKTSGPAWSNLRPRLFSDPWFDPAKENGGDSGVRIVAQAGSFKGYGGLFMQPPLVAFGSGHFVVSSGDETWILTADVFGATFHRATGQDFSAAKQRSSLPSNVHVDGSHVTVAGNRFEFPALGEFTSAAANATTLALTSRWTHSVILVALA